jgi:hypothetical protein
MISNNIELRGIEFTSMEYDKVRFFIVNHDKGIETLAESTVPENFEYGVNKYWDLILDRYYTVEELKQKRIEKEEHAKEMAKFRHQKELSAVENAQLKELFNLKSYYFKMPFVENASDSDKSLVRKAPNLFTLHYVVNKLMDKYVEENDISYDDLFEEIEDVDYEMNDDS